MTIGGGGGIGGNRERRAKWLEVCADIQRIKDEKKLLQ